MKIWVFSAKCNSMNWFNHVITQWRNHNVYGIILVKHPIMMWNEDDLRFLGLVSVGGTGALNRFIRIRHYFDLFWICWTGSTSSLKRTISSWTGHHFGLISLYKTSIFSQEPWVFILCHLNMLFKEVQPLTRIVWIPKNQLQIFFTVLHKIKSLQHLAWLEYI